VRIFSTFERAGRFYRRRTQSGRQTEQQRHANDEDQSESQHSPVRWKSQARGMIRRIDFANYERRGPPGE